MSIVLLPFLPLSFHLEKCYLFTVMNDSPDSPDELKRTYEEPKRTRQEPAEGIAGGRTPVETMARGENAETARAAGVRTK